MSRAQRLCLAQSGLSLAVVACAAVLVEPSWPRWLLLAGLALAVGVRVVVAALVRLDHVLRDAGPPRLQAVHAAAPVMLL